MALNGELDACKKEPGNCLALVILLDQFPRNMFRGSGRAFAADPLARDAARAIVNQGWDKRFPHRNAALGRQNTPEEIEFLKQPGSGF